MITAKDLRKVFINGDGSELVALKDLSFNIPEGQFVSVTGRSGSGKSTLLYQLSLLDRQTSGEVILDGINTNTLGDRARTRYRLNQLGYIFQDYALIPSLTAIENVALPLMMQELSKVEAYKKAQLALDRVGLGDKPDNLPAQLSGGQQQRVSIARAIGHNPKVVFADEPTANLDSATSELVLDAFLDLHRQGQTIVMVTHEPEYAVLAERIIDLDDGVIDDDYLLENGKRVN